MDTSTVLADSKSFFAFLTAERSERLYSTLWFKMLFEQNQKLALQVLDHLREAWEEGSDLSYSIHPNTRLTVITNLIVGFRFIVIDWLKNERSSIRISILFVLKCSFIYAKRINSCEIFRILIRNEPYGCVSPSGLWNALMTRYKDSSVEARIYWITITCTLINQNHLTDQGWRDLTERVAIMLSRELVQVRTSAINMIHETATRPTAERLFNPEVVEFLCHRIGDKDPHVRENAISAGGELYSAFMTLLNPRAIHSKYLQLLGSSCLMQYKSSPNEKERYLMEECLLEYIMDNRSDNPESKAHRILYFVTNSADQAVRAFANIIKNMFHRRTMLKQVLSDDLSKPFEQLTAETQENLKIFERTFSYQPVSITKLLVKVQSNSRSKELLLKLISSSPDVTFEEIYNVAHEFVGEDAEDNETVLRDQLLVRCGCTLMDMETFHRLLLRVTDYHESYQVRIASLIMLFSLSHELYYQTDTTLGLLCQLPTLMQVFIISQRSLHKISETQCAQLLAAVQQKLCTW